MTARKNESEHPEEEDWPVIRRDLIKSINEMSTALEAFKEVSVIKEKTYSDLISRLDREHAMHHTILFGDGTDKNIGLIAEIRQCKEERQNTKKFIGWVWLGALTGFFTVAADLIVHLFKRGPGP